MAKDSELVRIMQVVSKELDIPYDVIKYSYESMFKFIKQEIEKLPLKQDISEEEFNKLRVSFNLQSIGKLYTTYDKCIGIKKQLEYALKIKNKNNNEGLEFKKD